MGGCARERAGREEGFTAEDAEGRGGALRGMVFGGDNA